MSTQKVVMIIMYLFAVICWAMNIWGGWAERFYQKTPIDSKAWFWLTLFKIDRNKANCVKFIKVTSLVGIIISGIMVLVIFKLG